MSNMAKMRTAVIDNIEVPVGDERNLLELIRKAHIELPTFCYHSEISVYGACRMCMVEVEGRGIVPACSTPAAGGMVVRTNTKQIRDMRKMIVELLLANHDQNCTTCPKSGDCKLQKIARQMGISKVRFIKGRISEPDLSSDAILRDPKKCVLCGDCVGSAGKSNPWASSISRDAARIPWSRRASTRGSARWSASAAGSASRSAPWGR